MVSRHACWGLSKDQELILSDCTALWPYTLIGTEALRLVTSEEGRAKARDPSIMADAAFAMLNKPSSSYS